MYSYLLRCANRRTHQCWLSYKTIGAATGMSVNTVRNTYALSLTKDSSAQRTPQFLPRPVSSTTAVCSTPSVHFKRCWMLISRMSCAGWRWKEQDGSTQKMCCCKQGKTLVTACAPLCGLRAIRKVTSHCSSQTQPCQKRVAGVRHPVNSAQPKVAGEPRGRKMCRIKAGGRFAPPCQPHRPAKRVGAFP